MSLNKIGKVSLIFFGILFVVPVSAVFISENIFENIPEAFRIIVMLGSFLLSCLSVSFIFFNSSNLKRKQAIKIISIICSIIFLFGVFSKFMHWPGAAAEILISSFLFSFGCLPLIIKSRYDNRKTLISKVVIFLSLADLISIISILMGLLFRVLHWPGGNVSIITGAIILVITFIFWNISFRKEVKLRAVVEEKLRDTLNEVEEKNKEITDSINYAKRIQEAILPSRDFIKSNLPDYFLYYQPKDIVAGDFYWADKIGDTFLIAAADCTGHGVPGALVSVVCSNALNRSVKEFKETDPGKILDKTRELVLESFSKSGGDIKDGMDISLISIKGNEVKWAGANNPLWYITSKAGTELVEIKADKQPIGKTDNALPFTTHTLQLAKGDTLYLFTDGYADQFGGPKGKKFKYKQFEDLLVETNKQSLDQQCSLISKGLNEWKSGLEQVDDICVIGIRL